MDNANNISGADLKNFLIRRLGEKEADEVMSYVNAVIDKEVSGKTDAAKKEIAQWRDDMKSTVATKDDYAKFEKKLIRRVSRAEGTLILWSFVFWLTLIIALVIVLKIMK
ncbi:MAG TPA: hypothetical protein VG847_00580 [Chitinophagaceae bacterium]|nr:hypothetical protein [Chitinophagaceae bacterium]